ncbi:Wzt carbohydrate-binding domain-containing protein [Aeromonas veronii]|uniref:Wzt carbohydrate-binding domain-containing protein n=1 Tax=Aeromonas veronii TaxID=654 RepID=UPI0024437F7A|nr:Wzt carbohydrate-binding domain-containing protein [Aeromonas veronii]
MRLVMFSVPPCSNVLMALLSGGMCSSPPGQLSGWHVSAQSHIRVEFRFRVSLNAGTYFFNAGVQGAALYEHGFLARKLDALMFKVLPTADECSTGNVDFGLVCKIFSCSGGALEK